jgi:hypothetical protein
MKNQTDKPIEGNVAKTIEKQTSKIPSDVFLWGGLGLLATSAVMQAFKQKHAGLMIGQFAAPLLIMGVYNKLVKQHGSDRTEMNGKSTSQSNPSQPTYNA